MRRFRYIALVLAVAVSISSAACTQTSHRNVIPNRPGVYTSQAGVGVSTTTRRVPLPAPVYTGAIGIPGQAEAGFSGYRAFITKLIAKSGDSALSSSVDFGLSRGFAFGTSSNEDSFALLQLAPMVGHQFLLQFGDQGRNRASFGATASYNAAYEFTEPTLFPGPFVGSLFLEVGQRYSSGLQLSARVEHAEGLAPTAEDLDLNRQTFFLVALSWNLSSRIFHRTTHAHRTRPDDLESRRR